MTLVRFIEMLGLEGGQGTEKGRTLLVLSLQADFLVGIAGSQKRRRKPAKRC